MTKLVPQRNRKTGIPNNVDGVQRRAQNRAKYLATKIARKRRPWSYLPGYPWWWSAIVWTVDALRPEPSTRWRKAGRPKR